MKGFAWTETAGCVEPVGWLRSTHRQHSVAATPRGLGCTCYWNLHLGVPSCCCYYDGSRVGSGSRGGIMATIIVAALTHVYCMEDRGAHCPGSPGSPVPAQCMRAPQRQQHVKVAGLPPAHVPVSSCCLASPFCPRRHILPVPTKPKNAAQSPPLRRWRPPSSSARCVGIGAFGNGGRSCVQRQFPLHVWVSVKDSPVCLPSAGAVKVQAAAQTRDPKQRIVITGMGLCSVFGNDVDTYYDQ